MALAFKSLCGLQNTPNQNEQVDLFQAAVFAFELRFERELTRRWERLESEAAAAIRNASSGVDKYFLFQHFFDDVREQLAEVVGLYFPKLLSIAATNRHRLGAESPLGWTHGQVLRQVCEFLGVEEMFLLDSPPMDASRVLRSALQLSTDTGWLQDDSAVETRLPRWVGSLWGLSRVLCLDQDQELATSDLEPLSLGESQNLVRGKELQIHRRLERQIQDESFEGVIQAGMTGISVLDPFRAETEEDGSAPHSDSFHGENLFRRDGTTWLIEFEGEHCLLQETLGLNYIAVLLERPLQEVGSRELQSIAAGFPVFPSDRSKVWESLAGERRASDELSGATPPEQPLQFGEDAVIDAIGLRKLKERLCELKNAMDICHSTGDIKKATELENQHSEIEKYLRSSRNLRGRSRVFADETEKARQSITHALTRALQKIQAQCPKTATHLDKQIERGSKFMYRDASARWRVDRNP